jgi:peptide/nickel transport system substrate-binding protein
MYANCEMDALFKAARETGDAAEQAEIYGQIAAILNEDVPYNWLWFKANTNANTAALSDFEYYPNGRETFSQIEKWTLTR